MRRCVRPQAADGQVLFQALPTGGLPLARGRRAPPECAEMVRIFVTEEAFEAIKATLPVEQRLEEP